MTTLVTSPVQFVLIRCLATIRTTNSPQCFGGITHPSLFQGLSLFFLESVGYSHAIYRQHTAVQPSCQPINGETIWRSHLELYCNKERPNVHQVHRRTSLRTVSWISQDSSQHRNLQQTSSSPCRWSSCSHG